MVFDMVVFRQAKVSTEKAVLMRENDQAYCQK